VIYTEKLGLRKPEGSDNVNIDDLNYNANIIDVEINNIKTNNVSISTKLNTIENQIYDFSPYKNQQIFTSSGIWTCPAGVTNVAVWLVDGGTGSHGSFQPALSNYRQTWVFVPTADSGKMGLVRNIPVTPGQTYNVIVGSGGAGGSPTYATYATVTAGTAGGISSFNGKVATNALPVEQGWYPRLYNAKAGSIQDSGTSSDVLGESYTVRQPFTNPLLLIGSDIYVPLSRSVIKETYGAGGAGHGGRWQSDYSSYSKQGNPGGAGRVIIFY